MTEPLTEAEQVVKAAAEAGLSLESATDALLDLALVLPMAPRDGAMVVDPLSYEGTPYAAVFTHVSRIPPELREGRELTGPTLRQLAAQLPPSWGIAVNPAGPWGANLGVSWVKSRMGVADVTVPAGTSIRMGEPAEEPTGFLTGLASRLRAIDEVSAARRMWAAVGDESPGLVIGVWLSTDTETVRRSVAAALDGTVSALSPAFTITLVFGSDGGPMVEWMTEHAEPFHSA